MNSNDIQFPKKFSSLDNIPHSLCVSEREKKKGGIDSFLCAKIIFQ